MSYPHEAKVIDAVALHTGQLEQFPQDIFSDEEDASDPIFEIPDQARTVFEGILRLLTSSNRIDTPRGILAAGRRVLVLSWILGRPDIGNESLATLAERIGTTRALLSKNARQIEKATGIHSRGQKTSRMPGKYRAARLRVVERQKQAATLPEESF